jgi:branched-chain amino acid transport system substrate-binding protein
MEGDAAREIAAADALLRAKKYEEAERAARAVVLRTNDARLRARGSSIAGLAAAARGDCDSALRPLRHAMRAARYVEADLPVVGLSLARCLRARGRLVAARRNAERVLAVLRGHERAEAYEVIAAAAIQKGELARAAQALARAWRFAAAEKRPALERLALKLGARADIDELRIAFDSLRPDRFPAAHVALYLGQALLSAGRGAEVEPVLSAARKRIDVDPTLRAIAAHLRARVAAGSAPSRRVVDDPLPAPTPPTDPSPATPPPPHVAQPPLGTVSKADATSTAPAPPSAGIARSTTAASSAASPPGGAAPTPAPAYSMPARALRVVVLAPLSGAGAAIGERVVRGAKLGATLAEGSLPESVQIVTRDTRGDPSEAARIVDEVAQDPSVVAVVGPLHVKEALAAAAAAAPKGVPLIALSQADRLTAPGPSIFRVFLTPERQARAVARHAVGKLGLRRFAVLHPRTPYGQAMRFAFITESNRLNAQVVASVGYPREQTDFRATARELKSHEVDAIFFPDGFRTVASALGYLTAAGIALGDHPKAVRLLGTNEWYSDELLRLAGRFAARAVLPVGLPPAGSAPEAQHFAAAFQAAHGAAPTFVEAHAFDAVRLIRILTARGATVRASLVSALGASDVMGVTGPLRFDAQRELTEPPALVTVDAGAFRPVR